MKFWQSLAFVEMEQMVELARFCEQLGFYGPSYGDHLATTHLRFLSTIYRLPLRDPLSVAKALSTATVLSNDRITLPPRSAERVALMAGYQS